MNLLVTTKFLLQINEKFFNIVRTIWNSFLSFYRENGWKASIGSCIEISVEIENSFS